MKKVELKVNTKIQDSRTKEVYRILEIDCFGIAYAKKDRLYKNYCNWMQQGYRYRTLQVFFTNRKLKGDFKNGKRKYLFNHV